MDRPAGRRQSDLLVCETDSLDPARIPPPIRKEVTLLLTLLMAERIAADTAPSGSLGGCALSSRIRMAPDSKPGAAHNSRAAGNRLEAEHKRAARCRRIFRRASNNSTFHRASPNHRRHASHGRHASRRHANRRHANRRRHAKHRRHRASRRGQSDLRGPTTRWQ